MIIKIQRITFVTIICISLTTLVSCQMFRVKKDKTPKGTYTREILEDKDLCPWYAEGYAEYTPNKEQVTLLEKNFTTEHKILAFGGTWCGDTKNLLPKFYKVMDAMQNPPEVQMVLVDMHKESGEGIEKNYNIEFVPTFIVLKNGKETGRVVETVNESIEADLAAIITKE